MCMFSQSNKQTMQKCEARGVAFAMTLTPGNFLNKKIGQTILAINQSIKIEWSIERLCIYLRFSMFSNIPHKTKRGNMRGRKRKNIEKKINLNLKNFKFLLILGDS